MANYANARLKGLNGEDLGIVSADIDAGILIVEGNPRRLFRYDGMHQQSAAHWDKIHVFREAQISFIELPAIEAPAERGYYVCARCGNKDIVPCNRKH